MFPYQGYRCSLMITAHCSPTALHRPKRRMFDSATNPSEGQEPNPNLQLSECPSRHPVSLPGPQLIGPSRVFTTGFRLCPPPHPMGPVLALSAANLPLLDMALSRNPTRQQSLSGGRILQPWPRSRAHRFLTPSHSSMRYLLRPGPPCRRAAKKAGRLYRRLYPWAILRTHPYYAGIQRRGIDENARQILLRGNMNSKL